VPPAEPSGADPAAAWATLVALSVAALALGAGAGGYLVGRWGPRAVGVREASLAGLSAALLAGAATWIMFGPTPGVLLPAFVAAPAAALGGVLGLRTRKP
jgi:tRNA-(ms[2]io[6]A)-hydroxylase